MKEKKRKSIFGKTLLRLLLIIPNITGIFLHIGSLISQEARLAGKSLVSILVLAIIFSVLLITSWFCLLGMLLVYFITSLHWGWILSIAVILLLNLWLMLFVAYFISRLKKNLLFPETSRQCKHLSRSIRN